MAQTYTADVPDGTTNILQDNINGRNNENTLRSSFSGTVFPDTPVAGQHCYRTDTGIEYIYDGTAWIEVAATNTLGLDVAAAKGTLSNLSSRLNVSINPDGTLKDPTTANVDEFKVSNVTPTYVDATTFSVPDDLTGIFTAGRILKITDGAEIKYLSVVSSAFDTVTNVVIDGTITASISAVDYSLAQYGLPKASETVKGVVKVGANINVTDGVVSVPEATDTVKGVDWRRSPVGTIVTIPTDDVPTHCLECNGAEISRETYSELFAVIGAVYGAGDGSTTFQLPDLRGEFIRGWDNARGIDASRVIGTAQDHMLQDHWHHTDGPATAGSGWNIGRFSEAAASSVPPNDRQSSDPASGNHGIETRPRNVAMMFCIVYE